MMNGNGQDAPKKNNSRWTGLVNSTNSVYRYFFRAFYFQRADLGAVRNAGILPSKKLPCVKRSGYTQRITVEGSVYETGSADYGMVARVHSVRVGRGGSLPLQ